MELIVSLLVVAVIALATRVWGSHHRRLEELEEAVSRLEMFETAVKKLGARMDLVEKALKPAPPAPEAKPVPAPPPLPPPVPLPAPVKLPPPVSLPPSGPVAPLPEPKPAAVAPAPQP
ncbi:MAG TPA: hypothetical protein VN893_20515, partial [Bryobacteraceae bacterium]|nr:hypothetical protein [Bryobacteraceae bacterium]